MECLPFTDKMKKILFFFFVILLLIYAADILKNSPERIIENSIKNENRIFEYNITFSSSFKIYTHKNTTIYKINGTLLKRRNEKIIFGFAELPMMKSDIITFELPEGKFQCIKIFNYTCTKVKEFEFKYFRNAYDILSYINLNSSLSYSGQKIISGRKCDELKIKINEKFRISLLENFSENVNISRIEINACFDEYSGIPLKSLIIIEGKFENEDFFVISEVKVNDLTFSINKDSFKDLLSLVS